MNVEHQRQRERRRRAAGSWAGLICHCETKHLISWRNECLENEAIHPLLSSLPEASKKANDSLAAAAAAATTHSTRTEPTHTHGIHSFNLYSTQHDPVSFLSLSLSISLSLQLSPPLPITRPFSIFLSFSLSLPVMGRISFFF